MAKAVFITKVDPTYDDLPEERYHFPRTYLRQVEVALGDWIVYYEPRRTSRDLGSRGGRQSYFATARVKSIRPDPTTPDHFYAFVEDYLEFDRPVPFREGSHFYESMLRREDGETSKGAFGRAVRMLPDREYELILQAGFAALVGERRSDQEMESAGLADEAAEFVRPVVERVVNRPFREAAFASAVKDGLRQDLRRDRPEDHQWRWPGRGTGSPHQAGGLLRA